MPMQVISMLLGIPESDQEAVRDHVDASLRTKAGEPMQVSENFVTGAMFADYVDWRAEHPSDDIMTELLHVEFIDETGTVRKLTRNELLTYLEVLAGAGNETTTRLIGWTAKVLADHPDQRAELVADPSLIPNAIEEILRYESPAPHVGRCVARQDLVVHGTEVPAGSVMLFLLGSANRDDRRFPDGDTLRHPPQRRPASHLRQRHPPLHGGGARPHGRGHRARRGPDPLPRVGRRHGQCAALPHLDGAGLGDAPGLHEVVRRSGSSPRLGQSNVTRMMGWRRAPPRCGHGPAAPRSTTARCAANGPPRRGHASSRPAPTLLRGSSVRDWQGLTIRAVAEEAGVNERTVYRHFANEQGLHDAVMHRLEEEAGIDLHGMQLEDVADVTARIFDHVATFPPDARPPLDPTLLEAKRRQHEALLAAVAARPRRGPRPTAPWRRRSSTSSGASPATSAWSSTGRSSPPTPPGASPG